VLYGSLLPSDGAHGYFGWYEPLVGGLSGAAVVALGVLLAAGLLGFRSLVLEALKDALRPGGEPGADPCRSIGRLAICSLGLVLVQESLERSLGYGSPTAATFTPAQWLLLLATLSLLATAVVVATRSCATLLDRVFGTGRRRPIGSFVPAPVRRFTLVGPRRHKPLASGRALRAPPLLAG
jgi:hypothetical protein